MNYFPLAFSVFALVAVSAVALWQKHEAKKNLPAFLTMSDERFAQLSTQLDCRRGFYGSVIFHHEQRLRAGEPITSAGDAAYREAKARCAAAE